MTSKKPTIAIIGPGAIGGMLAACFCEAGYNPLLVCRTEETAHRIETEGIRFEGNGIRLHHFPKATTILDNPAPDYIFVATKGQANEAIGKSLAEKVTSSTRIISMQNGMAVDALSNYLPENQIIGCVISFGVEQDQTGNIYLRSSGEYVIGNLGGEIDPTLATIKQLLDTAQPCRISTNIRGELFAKLIISSCINPLSALTNLSLGDMLKSKRFRDISIGLIREGMAVAKALDIKVEPAASGKLDYYAFLKGNSWFKNQYRHLVLRIIGFKHSKVVTSSLQDIRQGKPTEIPYLNGWMCEQSEKLGIATPLNHGIVSLIRDIEAGRRKQSLDILNELNGRA